MFSNIEEAYQKVTKTLKILLSQSCFTASLGGGGLKMEEIQKLKTNSHFFLIFRST